MTGLGPVTNLDTYTPEELSLFEELYSAHKLGMASLIAHAEKRMKKERIDPARFELYRNDMEIKESHQHEQASAKGHVGFTDIKIESTEDKQAQLSKIQNFEFTPGFRRERKGKEEEEVEENSDDKSETKKRQCTIQ